LLTIVLGLSFRKLERVNQLLRERSQSLLRANQELALAAKTSAVGAVSAHLIHGLKNPLSGLQTFVASRGAAPGPEEDADWQMAISSTRRMQTMINEIVRVLRDEDSGSQYELSLPELAAMLETKVGPLAREAGVVFTTEVQAEGILRNREANLLSLVLYNLVQNAIQATPRGKSVSLAFRPLDSSIVSVVRDQGPGIPESVRAELFKPCRSSKEGGTGIGLAISKQLANSIGAELELQESTTAGSVFTLTFQAAHPAVADPAMMDRGGSQ
jgi:signal transduction histidine kinase